MKSKSAIITICLLILAGTIQAQTQRTGRSVAVAESGAMSMYGAQAVGWNPANLGLKANPASSVILASMGMSLGNNAFSPQYISDTFVEGDTLDDFQIDEILGKMDADQLRIYALMGIPAFGLSISHYALNLDAHILATAAIPSDIFELVMTGPVKDEIYDLSTVEEASMAYMTASLSAAQAFSALPYTQEFSVGASFKYVKGLAYGELEHKEGLFQITGETVHAEGFYRTLSSTIGDGVAMDLGTSAKIDYRDIYVGLTLGNILGDITWEDVEAMENRFYRNDGLNVDSLTKNDYWKNFLQQSDTTYDFGSVKTPLPRYLLLAADLPYLNGKGDLFMSYYQGLNDAPGQNTKPRVSLGTEFRWIPVLPLRVGMALGGIEGSMFSGGFGLRLLGYQLNVGAAWQRGFLADAEGFSIAITNYFGPGFKR